MEVTPKDRKARDASGSMPGGYEAFSDRLISVLDKRIPLVGHVELTFRCNFNCVHCYQKGLPRSGEISRDQWVSILDDMAEAGCLFLTMTGGDPMHHRDFEAIYTHAIKKGFIVTLYCNGTFISESIADTLAKYLPNHVEITLHGADEESFEKVTGSPGGYQRMIEGIRRIKKRNIALKLKTVVLEENVDGLGKMERFAADHDLPFRFETLVNPRWNGDRGPVTHRLSPKAAADLEHSRVEVDTDVKLKQANPVRVTRQEVYRCGAGRWFFSVDPRGNLHLCPTLVNPSISLIEHGFKKSWKNLRGALSRKFGDSSCGKCDLIDLCPRCPGASVLESGDDTSASPYFGEIARLHAEHLGRNEKAMCLGS